MAVWRICSKKEFFVVTINIQNGNKILKRKYDLNKKTATKEILF